MTATTLRTRPLTPAEQRDLAAARLQAAHRLMPYLATAVFRLRPYAVDGLGTFAVDDRWRLYVDPEAMDRWGVPATAGVLLHEVGHALRDHAGQARDHGPMLDHHAWNLCGDAAINDDLVASDIPLPGSPVLPHHLHDRGGTPLPTGLTVAQYYDALPRVDVVLDEPAGRDPGAVADEAAVVVAGRGPTTAASCGGVADGSSPPVEVPSDPTTGDEDDGVGRAEQQLVRRAVATAVRGAASGRGDVPAGLRRWADDELAPPTIPWQQELRATVRRGLAAVAGGLDPTYSRPSRRRVPGVVLPGSQRPLPAVAVVVDTSASMHQGLLSEAVAEVEGIARSVGGRGQRVRVLTVDAAVHTNVSITTVRNLELVGGGGTDLTPGLEAAVAVRPPADVVVVLTDGDTPWPSTPPRRATRWIVGIVGGPPRVPPPAWTSVVAIGDAP